jgi:hypothetical protein
MRYSALISRAALVVALAGFASPARAGTTLTLSDMSSDETSAADLSATLTFNVSAETLTLLVTNETDAATGFDISEVYFNAALDVTGLSLIPEVPGWTLLENQRADGFGTFDFGLLSDLGNDPAEIGPTESLEFNFEITGMSPFDDVYFTTKFSSIPPGEHPALAAAKFVSGPGDDSAFGAVIPEPATLLLMLLGSGLIARGAPRRP